MSVDVEPKPERHAAPRGDGLPESIQQLLGRLRGRIRRYLVTQGIAAVVIALGAAFWATLALDWLFEPPATFRALVMVVAFGLCASAAWHWLVRRARMPLTDRSLALLLERRFSRFDDGLITSVELTSISTHGSAFNRAMLSHTLDAAQRRAGGVDLDDVFDTRPRRRQVALATAVVLSIVALGLAWPEAIGIWASRMFALSSEPWPRDTKLAIEGFEDGVAKVARGGDLGLLVTADTTGEVPRSVQIRYRVEDGMRRRVNMSREGDSAADGEPLQRFTHTFQDVLAPIRFDVYGGDARLSDLQVEVVENPTLTELVVNCRFPEYLNLAPRELPVAGAIELPRGTEVILRAKANKPLVRVVVESPPDDVSEALPETIEQPADPADPRRFTLPLGELDADRVLLFRLHDTDGIESLEPMRLVLLAVPDEPPQISARPQGIGVAITPMARIPFAGQIEDDYALVRSWFEYEIAGAEPREQPFAASSEGRSELAVDEAFETRESGLTPGQQLTLAIKAEDAFVDGDERNVGTSERFVLDVVTPEALLAMLAARELNLRRRFEALMDEVTETRDSLARFVVEEDADAENPTAEAKDATAEQDSGDEPADDEDAAEKSAQTEESVAERRLGIEQLRVQRAADATSKNKSETAGLVEAFADIHAEMINNRIDNEELRSRLEDGIIRPLDAVAKTEFPELERRLGLLGAALESAETKRNAAGSAQEQADAILLVMQEVLDKIVELETFNEVLELLRGIIESQEKVNEKTRDLRKQQLRDFLE